MGKREGSERIDVRCYKVVWNPPRYFGGCGVLPVRVCAAEAELVAHGHDFAILEMDFDEF